MSKPNEPAFPESVRFINRGSGGTDIERLSQGGLTKRELFAAMLLQGMMGNSGEKGGKIEAAVIYADALLAELKRTEGKGAG